MKPLEIENPYEGVDWEHCHWLHSMSHQHGDGSDASCQALQEMGYHHFAFSNYYPSQPVEGLPARFAQRYPGATSTPNAEHHSLTDSSVHFNGLGSWAASGYGRAVPSAELPACPVVARFAGLCPEAEARHPGQCLYRLDVDIVPTDATAPAPGGLLTVEGACDVATGRALEAVPLGAGRHSVRLLARRSAIEVRVAYDAARCSVGRLRLMQGMHRPWREAFRAVLDGEGEEGGLIDMEGGGLTINHPVEDFAHYLPMLDFDPRVLGIEVWNNRRGFGLPLHYYRVWDEILRTGRRCWGFFAKDHRVCERGRNVVLIPAATPAAAREQAILRAYRRGAFFGLVGAMAVDESGHPVMPFDRSDVRFSRIAVVRDDRHQPRQIEVCVAGNDPSLRPNVQVRFITARGVECVVDGPRATFPLGADAGALGFVRVEAFAFPERRADGSPLTPAAFRRLGVAEIAALQTRGGTPGVVDLIFSQPLRVGGAPQPE